MYFKNKVIKIILISSKRWSPLTKVCGLTAILSLEDQEGSNDKTADGKDDVEETPDLRSKAFVVGKGYFGVEHLACLSMV